MCQEHVPAGKASGLAALGVGRTLVQLFQEIAALEPVPVGKLQQLHSTPIKPPIFPLPKKALKGAVVASAP